MAYSPGLRRRGATPGPGHIAFPTPQGVVPFVPTGGCDIKGRNGIGFAGAEEEPVLNILPLSTPCPHTTFHPFGPSAQPRWGCLCLWPLPGVAPPRRYPGSRPQRVPYPARGCAVRARRGCGKQGRNGIVFSGAEEESARNVWPLSPQYTHITCHPFEPSAQPRWGCLCLWPLPGVAPPRRNPGLYGRIPLGFPEGDGARCDLRIPGGKTAIARPKTICK